MAPSHDHDAGEKAERSTEKAGIIKRRRFIGMAGAAVFAAGATSTMGTASAATVDLGAEGLSPGDDLTPYLRDHWRGGNEVHIPGGSYRLSDPDALGINTDRDAALIGDGEVIADHGNRRNSYSIVAEGSAHVRLENITLKGVDGGGGSKIRPYAPSDNAVIELVNFNRPDGCDDGDDACGFYVPGSHAGVLRFINCHVEGFSNNGIYASSPGKEANGPVEVYGGLYKNNDVAGVRLGSAGSKAISVTVVNDAHGPGISGGNAQRGIRIREPGPVEVRDCDITQLDEPGVSGPIMVENHIFYSNRDGALRVENTRIRNDTGVAAVNLGESGYDASGDNIHLSGSGDLSLEGSGPYANVVTGSDAGAPTTEKRWVDPDTLEPVNGGGSDSGSSDDTTDVAGQRVEVIAASGAPLFTYGFVATGAVAPVTDAGSNSAEGNDTISETSDGNTQVTGEVGNGFGDTYQAEGDLLSFTADTDPSNFTLRIDGEEVDPAEVGADADEPVDEEPSQAEVAVVAADGGPAFEYSLLVTGTITKVTDAGSNSAEGNDDIVENSDGTSVVNGRVGNGFGDTFQVEGTMEAFEADTDPSNYTLLVDGTEVDPADLGGSDGSDADPLPNRISFQAADGQEGTYAFQVSGEVTADPDTSDLESADAISGNAVAGEITGGDLDSYRFSGDVVSLELVGAATVNIEDNE